MAVLLLSLGLTACTGNPSPTAQSAPSSTSPAPPGNSPVQFPTTPAGPPLGATPVAQLDLGTGQLQQFEYSNGQVVALIRHRTGHPSHTILLVDVTTGRQRVLIHAKDTDASSLTGVAITGNWVAWVTETSSNQAGLFIWHLRAMNIVTGRRVLLGSNAPTPDQLGPRLVAGDGYITWVKWSADRRGETLMTWRPGWTSPQMRIRFRGISLFYAYSIVNERYFYIGAGPRRSLDCWELPLDGTASPNRLTDTGRARQCATNGHWLVWRSVGPTQLQARDLSSGETTVLTQGSTKSGPLSVGNAFATWQVDQSIVIRSLTGSDTFQLGPALSYPPSRAFGHLVLFAQKSGGRTTLYVDRISRSTG